MPGLTIGSSRRGHAGAVREAEYATPTATVADTAEGIGGEQGLGEAFRRGLTAGLYNSDFGQLPEDLTQPIDNDNNPLPYWSFARAAGSAVTAQVVVDTSSASGYVLRFSMLDGTADDEAYIEQVAPINGSRGQSFYYAAALTISSTGSLNDMRVTGQIDWLKIDGVTTTGASTVALGTSTTSAFAVLTVQDVSVRPLLNPPADAYFMRIRLGFKRATEAVGSSGSVDFTEARVEVGPYAAWLGDLGALYGPALFQQANGQLTIVANNGSQNGASGVQLVLDGSLATGPRIVTSFAIVAGARFSLTNNETSTLTGAQDNVTLATNSTVMRWNGASGSTWTGLTGGANGRFLNLMNVTAAQTLILSHDVTSTAANRFYCPNNAAVSIRPNGSVILMYDSTSSRWRVMGA